MEPYTRDDVEQMKSQGLPVALWGRIEATVHALEQASLLLLAMNQMLEQTEKQDGTSHVLR